MNQHYNLEIAWAAGFFDGEGNTCCHHGVCGFSFAMSVSQVNRDNLFRFQKAVGGLGTIYEAKKKYPNARPISSWRAYGDKAFSTWRILTPLLGDEKNGQFLMSAIRYCFRTVGKRGGAYQQRCARNHDIALVGRYKDGDCNECRRLRRLNLPLPTKSINPTAFDLRLHGIREYNPTYEPQIQT